MATLCRDLIAAYDRAVGIELRTQRLARGFSQSALALKLGVSYQQYGKYESGDNRVSAGRLICALEVLGVSMSRFASAVSTRTARKEQSAE